MVNGNSMLPFASFLSLGPAVPPSAGAPDPVAAATPSPAFAELLNGLAARASAAFGTDGEATETAETAGADVEAQPETGPLQAATPAVAAAASGKILPVGLPEVARQETAKPEAPKAKATAKTAAPEAGERPAREQLAAPALAPTAVAPAAPVQQEAATVEQVAQVVLAAPVAVPHTALEPVPAAIASRHAAPRATAPSTGRAPTNPVEAPRKPQAAGAPAEQRAPAAVQIAVTAPAAATEAAEPVAAPRPKALGAAPLPAAEVPTLADRAPAPSPALVQPEPASPVHAVHAHAHAPSPADIDATLDRLLAAREALAPAEASVSIEHADFGEVSIRFEQAADGRLSAELSAADPDLPRAVNAAIAADRGTATGSDGGRSAGGTAQRGFGDGASGGRGHPGHDGVPARRQAPRQSTGAGASDSGIFA